MSQSKNKSHLLYQRRSQQPDNRENFLLSIINWFTVRTSHEMKFFLIFVLALFSIFIRTFISIFIITFFNFYNQIWQFFYDEVIKNLKMTFFSKIIIIFSEKTNNNDVKISFSQNLSITQFFSYLYNDA